jgi:hypothetical protein
MINKLEIVNRAMLRIGADPLQDLEDETLGGQAADLVYDSVIEFALGVYVFSFARKMVQLSELATATPLTGYTRVFDLPAERLGPPLRVTDSITDPNHRFSRYQLQGSTVHADETPLFAEIKFAAEPADWSGTFRDFVVLAVAAEYALSIAHDKNLRKELRQNAYGNPSENNRGGALGSAIREDSFATPPRSAGWDNNPLTVSHRSTW